MLPTLQGFNFGGGIAPFTSRVATYYMRDTAEGVRSEMLHFHTPVCFGCSSTRHGRA